MNPSPKTANRKPKTVSGPSITPAQRRKIHALKRQVFGDDDEGYREMLQAVARVKSSTELTMLKAGLVITHLNKSLGIADKPQATPQMRLIRRLWAQVSRAPAKEREKALRNFLATRFHVAAMEWLKPDVAWRVIEALKAMASRKDAKKGAKMIKGKVYFERGEPVTVLVRWNGKGPRNVLIQRQDGSRVVRPFRGLRKAGRE